MPGLALRSGGKVETINARETAPMGASENMFAKDPQNAKPGTPGLLRGYELAHKRHGRLQWKEPFEPSIKLALDGFQIGRALGSAIRGIITHEDLRGYKPVLNEHALNFTVGKYIFHAPDAPFGGPVLALILKGYNFSSSSVSTTENKILTYHRMIEAFRFTNAHKSKLGDPLYKDLAEVILNYLFFGYDLQKAAEEPRVQIRKTETIVEDVFDEDSRLSVGHGRSLSQICLYHPTTVNLSISLIHCLILSNKCYTKAAVAADAGTCSDIGRDILKRNGSAVDAAIATLLCVSLVNAQSVGIGGGGVFTIYNASTGKVETINARETAPMSASENMFGKDPQKAKPGLFIATPGLLRGYELAHKRHGRLQWKELFEPSIKLALDGFKVGRALALAINETSDKVLNNAALCEVFCGSHNKTILKEKDMVRFFQLAQTYKKIAEEGADAFYSGSLTQDILDDIKAAGGIITREDLRGYKPVLNEHALNFTVGKYIFHAPDAPFGGPVLALILNILKGSVQIMKRFISDYNFSSSSVSTTESKTLTYHRMIEAFRFANVQKSKLGDPVINENVAEIVKRMTSESLADEIRSKIKDDFKQTRYYEQEDSDGVPEDHGTSHLSVLAEDGSAVAVTSSINN
ncbi:gamma-glutamyltranspeptidase 1-like protein [Labeo rohita]|uniref:Glutathione hydrolase n=1 Tax=Labeo rohita TaxID=84645 RepID=A0A498NHL2_LABRO|nr:gamma-glutamyltranspeptidase 1-like protein [Labeo rohita]